MKLAIVTAYPPSKVTLNEYAYHLVKNFRVNDKVKEIVLLTDKTKEAKDIRFSTPGCKITIKECWEFNSYKNIKTVVKAIDQINPDVVFFNLQFMKFGDKNIPAALGLLLPMFCKFKGIPTIVLLHNILEEVNLSKAGFASNIIIQKVYNFIGTVLTKFILKADLVAVTMKKYADILNQKYKGSKVRVVPHGTFEVHQTPTYNIHTGTKKVMAFGKFGTYKKVEMMIEAVEKIRRNSELDLEIVIAGTDNPNVPGYLAKVKEQYKHVPELTFTGYVEEHKIEQLFTESAVVVFPYTSTTGSSGVLHQAGSYGKAVVMPNLGDLATLIDEEGYKGEFFDPKNVDSLANAIERIVSNDAHRVELGKANYKAATAFPMSRITDIYINEFEKLIHNKMMSKAEVSTTSII
ncbi:glycosyltransferase [Tenacibaculum sp. 190524A05c]|uniref:glycosyltransferase n=1 Tax=Tenacibaculum platacis TaxID=3137852 RepID=UPI0032B130FF